MKTTSPCDKLIIITGLPHIGKTTVVERVVAASPVPVCGFITRAAWENGHRVALDWVNHRHDRYRVAIRKNGTEKNGGHFVADRDTLDRAMDETFADKRDDWMIYMDEIGSLYSRSDRFVRRVRSLLGQGRILASMQTKGHVLFEEMIRKPNAVVVELTGSNRDDAPAEILRELFP